MQFFLDTLISKDKFAERFASCRVPFDGKGQARDAFNHLSRQVT